MRYKRSLLVGALLSALAVGAVWAQSVVISNLAGNELLKASIGLQPGGTGIYVPSYTLRSGENHLLVPTGTTVNTQVTAAAGIVLATGAITTWNVTLPANPYTGQRVIIGCPGGTVTTLSIAASASPSGQSIVGTNPTSCTSGGLISQGVGFTYSTTAKTWYRYL